MRIEAPQPPGNRPDLFTPQPMAGAELASFMAEHKIPRVDQITYGPNGEIFISGRTVAQWDHENELFKGSDNPFSN